MGTQARIIRCLGNFLDIDENRTFTSNAKFLTLSQASARNPALEIVKKLLLVCGKACG